MEQTKTIGNKSITIYDIAREAGVSPATVSRVLTGSVNVRREKKEKVQKIIDKYNFKPNALARGLSDTHSKVIGVLAADVRNPYYAQLFIACEVAAQKRGYNVLLCNFMSDKEQEREQLEKLQEQRVDAIIQIGGTVDDLDSDVEYVEFINNLINDRPVVVTGKLDGTECYSVRIDAMKTMDLLMEHLLALGHRDIALVGGRMDVLSTFEKVQRYRQILRKHQIAFREELIISTRDYVNDSAYERMNELLGVGIRPTAVIAINDFSAAGIMRSIHEHGLRIPEDISLVSYDNTFIAELLMPKLTSIDYDYDRYGELLIETAVGTLEGKEYPRLQLVMPTLIVRGSSGMAPDKHR